MVTILSLYCIFTRIWHTCIFCISEFDEDEDEEDEDEVETNSSSEDNDDDDDEDYEEYVDK